MRNMSSTPRQTSCAACWTISRMRASSATVNGSPCSAQRRPFSVHRAAAASSSASAESAQPIASPSHSWTNEDSVRGIRGGKLVPRVCAMCSYSSSAANTAPTIGAASSAMKNVRMRPMYSGSPWSRKPGEPPCASGSYSFQS